MSIECNKYVCKCCGIISPVKTFDDIVNMEKLCIVCYSKNKKDIKDGSDGQK